MGIVDLLLRSILRPPRQARAAAHHLALAIVQVLLATRVGLRIAAELIAHLPLSGHLLIELLCQLLTALALRLQPHVLIIVLLHSTILFH